MQGEGTLRFLWFLMKTLKPSIPSLSSIKQFKLPVDLQPQKVCITYPIMKLLIPLIVCKYMPEYIHVCINFVQLMKRAGLQAMHSARRIGAPFLYDFTLHTVAFVVIIVFAAPIWPRCAVLCHQFN